MADLKNTVINNTGALKLPSGTVAQRPTIAVGAVPAPNSYLRYNSTFKTCEMFDGSKWIYLPDIVRDGLKLHLDAWEPTSYSGSGTAWNDLSGAGIIGAVVGFPTYTNGYFRITSDATYVTIPNATLIPQANDFTYSCWMSFDSTIVSSPMYNTIFENGSWGDCLLLRREASTVTLYAESVYFGAFDWTPTPLQWCNIVLTRRASEASLYVNNSLIGTLAFTPTISLANPSLWLMRSQHNVGQFTVGKLASFSIYSKALSPSQIQQNFNAVRKRYGI